MSDSVQAYLLTVVFFLLEAQEREHGARRGTRQLESSSLCRCALRSRPRRGLVVRFIGSLRLAYPAMRQESPRNMFHNV